MTIQETFEQDVTPPIVVNETPVPDQLWSFLRQIIPPLVTFAVGRGYIGDDIAVLIGALILGVGAPIGVGQLKTRLRALQLSALERKVPDNILTTKAKANAT